MNPDLIQALEVMGKGMFGIFAALSIVYFFILILVKVFPVKEDKTETPNQD